MKISRLLFVFFIVLSIVCVNEAKKKKKSEKGLILRQKETNVVNFIRLAAMRLIFGIATRLGFGDQISEALNGAFVPPGVDEYDDYGGGFFGEREDYDY